MIRALLLAVSLAAGLPATTTYVDLLPQTQVAPGGDAYAAAASGSLPFVSYKNAQVTHWPSSLWLRVALPRIAGASTNQWLIALPREVESADLYRPGEVPLHTGMYVAASKRPADIDAPAFDLTPSDFARGSILIHVVYYPDVPLAVDLWTDHAFQRDSWGYVLIEGFFLGMLTVVAVINLFVFITIRDRNALWYVSYIAALMLGLLATADIGDRYIWTNLAISARWMRYVSELLTCITFFGFERSFLSTAVQTPRWDRAILGYVGLYSVVQLAQAATPLGPILDTPVLVLQLLGIALAIAVAVARLRARFGPARFFLFAFIPMAVGTSMALLNDYLPDNDALNFIAANGIEWGVMLQAVVLSFSVADRMRLLERLHGRSQQQLKVMESLAHSDLLTGLGNRLRFTTELQQAVDLCKDDATRFTVLYCDLDGFKDINDRFGHSTGDDVLRVVGDRLRACVRGNDLVCRIGGDEFAIILYGISEDRADLTVEKLRASILQPIAMAGAVMPLGVSIGKAVYPRDGATLEQLMHAADARMYAKKRSRSAS